MVALPFDAISVAKIGAAIAAAGDDQVIFPGDAATVGHGSRRVKCQPGFGVRFQNKDGIQPLFCSAIIRWFVEPAPAYNDECAAADSGELSACGLRQRRKVLPLEKDCGH